MPSKKASANDSLDAWLGKAIAFQKKGNLRRAEIFYRRILSVNPEHEHANHFLGLIALETGNPVKAIDLIQKALLRNSTNPFALNHLGNAYMAIGQFDNAKQQFCLALKYRSDFAEVYNNLGVVYQRQNDLLKALEHFTTACEKKEQHLEALCNLAKVQLQLNYLDSSINTSLRLLSFAPSHADSHLNIAICKQRKGIYTEAKTHVEKALSLYPDSAQALLTQGDILGFMKMNSRAIDSYQKALRIDPSFQPALNNLALLYRKMGHLDAAKHYFEILLKLAPHLTSTRINLGSLYREIGDMKSSLECYLDGVLNEPNNDLLHFNLANLYRSQNNYEGALTHFKKALEINPNNIQSHNNLGLLYQSGKHYDLAESHFEKAIKLNQNNGAPYNNLGFVYLSVGKLNEAEHQFLMAIEKSPEDVESYRNLANLYLTTGQYQLAAKYITKSVQLSTNNADSYNEMGILLSNQGDYPGAIVCYKKALECNASLGEVHINLANVYRNINQPSQALVYYDLALKKGLMPIEVHFNKGNLFREQGDFKEAIRQFNKCLELDPSYAKAHRQLVVISGANTAPAQIRQMKEYYNQTDIQRREKIQFAFALGKVHEDMGSYPEAFEYFKAGNTLYRQSFTYDSAKDTTYFDKVIDSFPASLFAKPSCGFAETSSIFILGMPRSGTTLIEQMLSAHPDIYPLGERKELSKLVLYTQTRKEMAFPDFIAHLSNRELQLFGRKYIEVMKDLAEDSRFFTNKMPGNFLLVGLIHLILPNAKIIHAVRDPMDTCLSIFKQFFTVGHNYAYSLEELGRYYRLYARVMKHWKSVVPEAFIEVQYEEMVSQPEENIRQILDYCGLPFADQCLSFHSHHRPVRTASAIQVRQPLYQSSVKKWKNYEAQLEPLHKIIFAD